MTRGKTTRRTTLPRRTRADRDTAKHLLSVLKAGGDMRVNKIKTVRAKVRTRSYENDLKLLVAIDKILVGDVLGNLKEPRRRR